MSASGLVAVEAQLTSTAQRHLQVRFGPVQISRGDGWVLFQFQTSEGSEKNELPLEMQRLCSALVRDVTGRTALRLTNEQRETNFGNLADNAVSFTKLINKHSNVGDLPADLSTIPDVPAAAMMLDMLYNDVAADLHEGAVGVTDFPAAMCPTGTRFDVLMQRLVCVRAFSSTTLDLLENEGAGMREASMMDVSLLQGSYSTMKLPSGPLAKVWIDTHALAHALSSYSTASVESELPALWRSKAFALPEAGEVLKIVHQALIDYWNRNTHTERIKINAVSLLSIVAGDLREYIKGQVQLQGSDWRGPWRMNMTDIRTALKLCKQWNMIISRVSKQDWNNWDGGRFHDESFNDFAKRLHDVVRIREMINNIVHLKEEVPDALLPETIFEGVSMTDLRGTTTVVWERSVAAFEKELSFLDPKLRNRVRKLFANQPSDNQVRLLLQFSALLRRESIQDAVDKEMTAIAEYMVKQLDGVKGRYENNIRRATTDLQKLRAAKSCQAECSTIPETAYRLFGPNSTLTERVAEHAGSIIGETRRSETNVVRQWCTAIAMQASKMVQLEDAVVVSVDEETHHLSCTVSQPLLQYLQDVRNLRSWCGPLNEDLKMPETAGNAIRACEQLVAAAHRTQQSVANYNIVLQQIIPCTRAMLQATMQRTLSQILFAGTTQRVVAVSNYQELEGLNLRFQNSVEALSSENRHIRRFHCDFISQVIALHNVDLTKHMDQWRSAVDGMRGSFDEFLSQHRFENYDEWRRHWDCQLYKALEYQYCRGLESLHENMEEFRVELVFKQGVVQFKPSFEAIREAYYVKLREFVSVPLRFRGLQPKREGGGTYEIYPTMPLANNERIITVHTKAIELFHKLNRVRKAFRSHIVVGLCGTNGTPDLDSIVEQWASETDRYAEGFFTVKEHLNKMSKIEDVMRVDCFSISTVPVKASMEEQLHRLEEALLNSMRRGVQQTITEIDDFVFATSNVVERQPTTMDEVGQANVAYRECLAKMPEYEAKYKSVEKRNKELRQQSGASIDLGATRTRWEHLRDAMSSHTKVIEASVAKMRVSLDSLIQKFLKDVQRFSVNWNKHKALLFKAFKDKKPDGVSKSLAFLKDQMNDLADLKTQGSELESKCNYFNQPKPNFSVLERTVQDVDSTSTMWGLYDSFQEQLAGLRNEDWLTFRAHTYQFDDFCKEWRTTLEKTVRESKETENVIADYLLELLRAWNDVLLLLKFVRGDGWMTEHWNEMFRLVGIDRSRTSATLCFGDILDHYDQVLEKQAELKQLHARAQGEIQLREALQDLRTWALEATFTLVEPTDCAVKVKLISEWKDVMTQVSDNQALVGSLKDSPFYQHFADEATGWEVKLASLSESLQQLNSIQRKWTYLEPIFARGALPQEQARFKRVDKEFVSILREVEADPRVMSMTSQIDFNDKLKGILEQMERCQKSLMEYLDAKRDKLPRFYFISDEDLLEILGHSQNPSVIQSHLKKLFMGINSVVFNENESAIVKMVSADHEEVALLKPVPITDNDVEDWLIRLDECMKTTLRELLSKCVAESDPTNMECIQRYPSQILQVALQIHFTARMEAAIPRGEVAGEVEKLKRQLDKLTGASADADTVSNLKIKALILDIIHNIEVAELLITKRVKSIAEWWWQKQLRYTIDERICRVHMLDTSFDYTYEYQGNAAKLVHTPLTDKCYLVLTKGMGLGYGGNPYGPAGTGKTESVKALGSAMGRQVLVFNCDEGIDFKAMGRIFVGIVKCGAWGCFDEFNRLKIDQLSAISQMIQVIQEALKSREPTCPLLNKTINVNPNAGIFVTLNPAGKGYGGRTKLPDNLKQLFREVAMSVPDNELITATMLLSEGFTHARALAKNVVELYKLCGQLMSHQQHYDWGLRPLKAVLRLGGTLVQRWKKQNSKRTPSSVEEAELMLQSLNINTLSKLTFDDARLFGGLLRDIFPGVEAREITYSELEAAITTAVKELGLQPIPSQTRKVLQLYEAMNQRMGVVLVGPSGSGKSTLLTILRKALQVMNVDVPLHAMNSKAMPRQQLLGYMDPDTREWYDGVLTAAARDAVKQPKDAHPWILCDGDIDPEWIESLNSVLDDNKLLTMPNGVRIQFGPNVNFIFETHSLEFASPATVSRMGVLFFSEKDVHLEAVVESIMERQASDVRKRVGPLVNKYTFAAIDEAIRLDSFSVPTTPMGLLNACLNHVMGAQNEADFIYGMIRGLGSALTPAGALKLAEWLYKTSKVKPQSDNRPLDTYWDTKTMRAAEFVADLNATITPASFVAGHAPVIKTVEVQRLMATLHPLVQDPSCKPFFLVGPEGCGKGAMLKQCFSTFPCVHTTTINCSAQTTSTHVVQKLDQLCSLFSTNSGRVYRPRDGERLVLVLKNVNLPKPDKYGTVELHSFMQQLILYKGFYSKELEWIGVEKVQLVASMNPAPSAGRYSVAPRLLAVVNIVSMSYPSKQSMLLIYATYWAGLLRTTTIGQGKDYQNGHELAQFVMSVFDRIRRRFEGEEYAHFYFCPRHVTNWIANALLYKIDAQTTLPAVLAYEAQRIFADCLPRQEDRARAEKIFAEQLATIGYSVPSREDRFATMFVTWFSDASSADTNGIKQLQQKKFSDVAAEAEGALLRYSREFKDLGMTVIPEVISWVTRVDRVFARPGGHVIIVGRPGVGRRDAVILAAYMQRMEVTTLNMTHDYAVKDFRNDLRTYIHRATVQNTPMVLILEDHNIVKESFLECVNGLVSSGEVPGLFTPEELEGLLAPLREEAARDGHMGPIYSYFLDRLQRNLRVALIMDNLHELFLVRLQSNPGLLSKCELMWMGTWSNEVTRIMCKTRLKDKIAALEADPGNKGFSLHREMFAIHESLGTRSTPKDFQILMETYSRIMDSKSRCNEEKIVRLETGLTKLKEAEGSVEAIKTDVAKKKSEVERMQKEADKALDQIQKSMQDSQEQRDQATELQEQLKEEHDDIVVKRGSVEDELSSIKPMLDAAKDAVSTIRSEQLNEIRSLKAPPEPIRDVLEGVLALLGVNDVSWQSMRKFLGERGAKERILEFNVKDVTPQIRASVSKLLQQKATSFKQEVIHRASVAAAPMAEWVKAMVGYSTIMERIAPLTRQLEQLEANQKEGEEKLEHLRKKLRKIDKLVEELREEFSSKCKEAERLRTKLTQSEEELVKAQDLLEKLSGEKTRWATEAGTIREATRTMPKRALVAAAFITYLCEETEDVRLKYVKQWSAKLGFPAEEPVSFTRFMRTEGELLQFKAESLPGDELSLENAVAMIETGQTPLVVDPANQAIEWAKEHLKRKNAVVEVASMHDERFTHTLELAIRFGKTLLVTEVGGILPMLYPVLRRDLISAGAKRVVQVGNKQVDWQDTFKIILFSRNTDMKLPPGAAALLTEVNFSVTSLGLESQLLGITIQHEKPELEEQKVALLKQEEALKVELSKLEIRLLDELADSQGNLLENVQLINSLNEVKTQASNIQDSLKQSNQLQRELDDKREVYRPFAQNGSLLYFIIADMERLNRMYQFGLPDFIALFTATLTQYKGSDEVAHKVKGLVKSFARTCFHHITLGLFKKDRIAFGLHLLHAFNPKAFPSDQYDALIGAVKDVKADVDEHMPSWAPLASKAKFAALYSCESGPALIEKWGLTTNRGKWEKWMQSQTAEKDIADSGYSVMEQLLLVNVFRPDRLGALSLSVILQELQLDSLAPAVSLEESILGSSAASSPVLLITSSGADPSLEVQDIAMHRVGKQRFTQVALGGGQTDEAMQQLRRCAVQGDWIFLKNLHLVLDWASVLEKELCAMPEPNKDFRLIITTEQHDLFPSVLLRMATKVTVEAPPGVKQNLLRTYGTWDSTFVENLQDLGSQLLFGLAWFHAVVQERRTFVPQGWAKAYEFSPADLKAASDVLVEMSRRKSIDWITLKGVLENCIYGGRLDNPHDERVLIQLLDTYFTEDVIVRGKVPLYHELNVPASCNHDHIVAVIRKTLPDVDAPDVFYLPDNADRAVLETAAGVQIEDLRCLSQRTLTGHTSSDGWKALLTPVLEQWKAFGLAVSGPPRSIAASKSDPQPMDVFFVSEVNLLSRLITALTEYYEELHAVAEGTQIPESRLRTEALELAGGRMPGRWLDKMDGPRESKLWLSLLSRKYAATNTWLKEPMSASIVYDLSNLLRPETFFNALRQHTARQSKAPLVDLQLVACVGTTPISEALQVNVSVKSATIFVQGAVIGPDGKLRVVSANSPSSVALSTNIVVGWMSAERAAKVLNGFATIPVYNNAERQTMIFRLSVPCAGPAEEVKLSLGGVGCFLMAV